MQAVAQLSATVADSPTIDHRKELLEGKDELCLSKTDLES